MTNKYSTSFSEHFTLSYLGSKNAFCMHTRTRQLLKLLQSIVFDFVFS